MNEKNGLKNARISKVSKANYMQAPRSRKSQIPYEKETYRFSYELSSINKSKN